MIAEEKQDEIIENTGGGKNESCVVARVNTIIIPDCCREGWDSCKHVAKPEIKGDINPAF